MPLGQYDRSKAKPNKGMFLCGIDPRRGGFKVGHPAYYDPTGTHMSDETKEKISKSHKGRIWSPEVIKRRANSNRGKIMSEEAKLKISLAQRGEKGNNWKGGKCRDRQGGGYRYSQWRKSVFERDNYMCIIGGKDHGSNLQAHHIISWSMNPTLRYKISNGITLCINCHKQTDNYGAKGGKRRKNEQ